MSFRNDIDEYMDKINVDDELKEKIYNSTIDGKRKANRTSFAKKRMVILAAACIICFGTIVVAAAEWSGVWNKTVAKIFLIDENLQKSISDKGYVEMSKDGKAIASDTQNGVTVSVEQVISDKYALYIYLNITSKDMDFSGREMGFQKIETSVDGDFLNSEGRRSVKDTKDENDKGCGFWLYYIKEEEKKLDNKEINIKLQSLYGLVKSIHGEWNLKWNLGASQKMKEISLDNTWVAEHKDGEETKSATVKLNKLEISPISFCLRYDYSLKEWNEFDGINNELVPIRIKLKDGTCYSRPIREDGEIYLWTTGTGDEQHEIGRFEQLIDTDNIEYVEIGDKKYEFN